MRYVKLPEIAEMGSGGTPSRKKKEYYKNGSVPWLKSGELNNGIVTSAEEYITEKAIKESSAKIAPKGSLLVAMYGATAGKVGLLDFESSMNQAVCFIKPDIEEADVRYLYYYLMSKNQELLDKREGGGQPNISQTILKSLKIPLPSLSEQKAIVAKLDRAQRLIDIDREMLAKYDDLIQSVFLEMFGDPVTNSLDWDMVPFTEIIVLKRGYDLRVKDRVEGKYPIMASNGVLDWHNEYKVEGPGVVTGRSGTLGKVHYVNNNYWPLNTALYSKELRGNNPIFVLYLLKNFNLGRFSRGAGVPTLNRNLVHKEKIIDVPIKLQNSFTEKVSQIEIQKSISKESLKKSEELFSSLVQGVFG